MQDDQAEYSTAVRTAPEPIHYSGAELRLSLFLHAEVLVCVSGEGAGGVSWRVWDTRRAIRATDAGADQEAGEEDHGGDLWVELLEERDQPGAAGGEGCNRDGRPGTVSVCGYAGGGVRTVEDGVDGEPS